MGVSGTGNFSSLLAPGFRKIFNQTLVQIPTEYTAVYNINSSKRNYEEDHKVAGFGAMTAKPQGEPVQYDDPVDGGTKRYTHSSFAKGFRITREMNDDDLYSVMMKYPKALGKSAHYGRETNGWKLYNNGTVTTFFSGYDTLALLSTAHTLLKTGGTFSNRLATDSDLGILSLQEALLLLDNIVDDSGNPMGGYYTPKYLVVPTSLRYLAGQLVGSQYEPFTPDNQINVKEIMALKPLVSHFLNFGTSGNGWYIVCTEHDVNWFNRTPIEFDNQDDFDTKDAKYTAFERYSNGFGDPRGIVGTPAP